MKTSRFLLILNFAVIGCTGFKPANLNMASSQSSSSGNGSTSSTGNTNQNLAQGAQLYATNCAGCHGSLLSSTKAGRTSSAIQSAITSVGEMHSSSLIALSSDQVNLIAQALANPAAASESTSGAVVGATALSVTTATSAMNNYKTLTGTVPSANTQLFYTGGVQALNGQGRRYQLPPTGDISNYSSSTLMLTMVATTEHCSDLVTQEISLAASKRVFFADVNLNASDMSALTDSQVITVATNMGNKFWRRAPVAAELTALRSFITDARSQGLSTENAMIGLCAAALSSVSANVR